MALVNVLTVISATIFIVLLFAPESIEGQRPYEDCGSAKGKAFNLTLSPCPPGPSCVVKRGENVSLDLAFVSNEKSTALTAIVHGIIDSIPIPFPLPQPDACKDSGINCPLQPGQSYTYKMSLPIRTSYPPVSVTVQVELKDDSKLDVVCIKFPMVIT